MYKISTNISVEEIQNRYFLKDSLNNKVYEINQSIFDLLQFFKEPNNITSYIEKIKEKSGTTFSNVDQIIMPFFNQLLKAEFILKEEALKKDAHLVNEKINCNDIIDKKYEVIQIIQNKRNIDYVLLVEDTVSSKRFVIKLTLNKNEKYIKKSSNLIHEFNIIKGLFPDENIINAIDIIEGKEKTYMILEYIDNAENLYNFTINNHQLINDDTKEHLISQILRTFSEIHKKKILHGDIHFKNILISNQKHIKIIDFGLSNNFILIRNEKKNKGGIHYFIPPERLGDNSFKKLSSASTTKGEVYQIGLLIYFILFEKMPFDAEKWSELQKQISLGVNEIPQSHYLNLFLLKSLNVNPEKRFSDACELYDTWSKRR